jgi:hypothetical protein
MAKVKSTSHFEISDSRRLGLDRCEFDVVLTSGTIGVHDIFQVVERGSLWEWVVLKTEKKEGISTLHCMNWVPSNGAFVGEKCSSRPLKAIERKRYAKYLETE